MKLIKYWDGGWYVALLVKAARKYCYIVPIDLSGLSVKRLPISELTSFKFLETPATLPSIDKFRQMGKHYGMTKAVKQYLEADSA